MRMTTCKALVVIFISCLARGQTLLSFDQASKMTITWSRGIGTGPRISPLQIRRPALTFAADPAGLVIRGDRQCTVVIRPGNMVLLYVMWIHGQLAVLAGVRSGDRALGATETSLVYIPTLEYVDLTGDCVPAEAIDGNLPKGVQQLLYVGVANMPQDGVDFGGTCTNSIQSYSMDGHGLTVVMDYLGVPQTRTPWCGN